LLISNSKHSNVLLVDEKTNFRNCHVEKTMLWPGATQPRVGRGGWASAALEAQEVLGSPAQEQPQEEPQADAMQSL